MTRSKQVLVTGGTGFVAKHIIRLLLDEGFHVRASVRTPEGIAEIQQAVLPQLKSPDTMGSALSFCTLDLLRDDGWDEAMAGCGAVLHTASPVPIVQPEDENDLITPAVEGTRRMLVAAQGAGVARVILTSSESAITGRRLPGGRNRYDETDWTDTHSPFATPYVKSKTLAERAAWNFCREHPEMKLTVINPGLILGPTLDAHIGASLQVVQRIMTGRDPLVPALGFPIVDVRDIALMHLRALQREESIGMRFIGAERFMWMVDIAQLLKTEYPDRRIPTRQAPDWLVRILARFDKAVAGALPRLGHETPLDSTQAAEMLGMEFIDARQAIKQTAASLIRDGLVP